MQKDLTIERLNGEYLNWTLQFGEENNNLNISFSQYISFNYEFKANPNVMDSFGIENTTSTYNILIKTLEENDVQNTL